MSQNSRAVPRSTHIITPTGVALMEGLKIIDRHEFQNRTDITSIIIPNSVETIDNEAFSGCKNLVTINLPSILKTLNYNAFSDCKKLSKIILPDGLEEIGDGAFQNCTSLTSVIIPDSVKRIGTRAFYGCKKLKKVSFNILSTKVFKDSFEGTPWFNSNKKDGFVIADGLLFCPTTPCEGDLVIPDGVQAIAGFAFYKSAITSLNLPEGLERIDDRAFERCTELKTIKFPSTIRKIGQSVFIRCDAVSKVEFENNDYLELNKNLLYKKDSRRVKILTLVDE